MSSNCSLIAATSYSRLLSNKGGSYLIREGFWLGIVLEHLRDMVQCCNDRVLILVRGYESVFVIIHILIECLSHLKKKQHQKEPKQASTRLSSSSSTREIGDFRSKLSLVDDLLSSNRSRGKHRINRHFFQWVNWTYYLVFELWRNKLCRCPAK